MGEPAPKTKAKASPKVAAKKAAADESDDSSDEPAPKAKAKASPKVAAKKAAADDSDDEAPAPPPRKKLIDLDGTGSKSTEDRTVFVGGLPFSTTEEQLRKDF